MPPTTQSDFGACMASDLSKRASRWILTTLASTEKQPHLTEALPTNCVAASVRVSLVPSLK
jgi:hypothetical protein